MSYIVFGGGRCWCIGVYVCVCVCACVCLLWARVCASVRNTCVCGWCENCTEYAVGALVATSRRTATGRTAAPRPKRAERRADTHTYARKYHTRHSRITSECGAQVRIYYTGVCVRVPGGVCVCWECSPGTDKCSRKSRSSKAIVLQLSTYMKFFIFVLSRIYGHTHKLIDFVEL